MKKAVPIVSLTLGACCIVYAVVSFIVKMNAVTGQGGIIGGADTPTALLVSKYLDTGAFLLAGLACMVIGAILSHKRK